MRVPRNRIDLPEKEAERILSAGNDDGRPVRWAGEAVGTARPLRRIPKEAVLPLHKVR